MTRILSADDVRTVVRAVGLDAIMDQLIDGLDAAFRSYDPAHMIVPVRDGFDYEHPAPGLVEWMPMRNEATVTLKVVAYHANNPARGLPTVLSTISAYEVGTGHLLGIVDGTLLTALRTGAASALASRTLADPSARTLGLVGCGAQAVTQLHAISRLFALRKVLVHDSDPAVAASFRARSASIGVDVEVVGVGQVMADSDILCTATSVPPGAGPVLSDRTVRPGLHINAVGSDFPGKVELPASLLRRAFVTADFPAQALEEGECQQLSADELGPPLAQIMREPELYRHARAGLSVFDSTGWALEDHVVMELFMRYASDLSLGAEVEIEHVPADPHDPYCGLQDFAPRRDHGVAPPAAEPVVAA